MERIVFPMGAPNAFFGRRGGVSDGIYTSLNCGFGSDDDAGAVAENRRRVCEVMGGDALQTCHQVHSNRAVFLDGPLEERPKADGLVTTTPGLVLAALGADCAPVLLADADAGVVGACHAGWRGAVTGITDATIALMREHGATRIRAVVGPCIGVAAYEVGESFRAAALALDADAAAHFHTREPGGDWIGADVHFDLPHYLLQRLAKLDAEAAVSGHCTYHMQSDGGARYFSYRRATHLGEPDYGRNISAIRLA